MSDEVRWFDAFPKCCNCGKTAHGLLRGLRNDSYGAYCLPCGNRRLKAAEKEREEFAKIRAIKDTEFKP